MLGMKHNKSNGVTVFISRGTADSYRIIWIFEKYPHVSTRRKKTSTSITDLMDHLLRTHNSSYTVDLNNNEKDVSDNL